MGGDRTPLTQVNLTPGPRAFPFIGRRFADELALCTQRLRGQVATSASGHVTVTYSKPFAAPPVLVVTALRSVSNVVVVDLLPGSLGAASFQVATYIAGGGISANSVSWIAEGIPAGP